MLTNGYLQLAFYFAVLTAPLLQRQAGSRQALVSTALGPFELSPVFGVRPTRHVLTRYAGRCWRLSVVAVTPALQGVLP
jgi:hypothetical protein